MKYNYSNRDEEGFKDVDAPDNDDTDESIEYNGYDNACVKSCSDIVSSIFRIESS